MSFASSYKRIFFVFWTIWYETTHFSFCLILTKFLCIKHGNFLQWSINHSQLHPTMHDTLEYNFTALILMEKWKPQGLLLVQCDLQMNPWVWLKSLRNERMSNPLHQGGKRPILYTDSANLLAPNHLPPPLKDASILHPFVWCSARDRPLHFEWTRPNGSNVRMPHWLLQVYHYGFMIVEISLLSCADPAGMPLTE